MGVERKQSGKKIFDGKILKVRVDEVALPNGKTAFREVADHPGGVGIVALTEEDEVFFVRQYRYALEEEVLEIPAGKMDEDDPLACGKRELREEIKRSAETWTPLGCAYPSPGCMNERLYLYLAEGLSFDPLPEDEDEELTIEKIPLERAARLCLEGEIRDAKSVIGILKTFMLKKGL